MSVRLNAWHVSALALVLLSLLVLGGERVARHAGPWIKSRVLLALTTRFHSRFELDDLQVSLLRGLQVTGHGLRMLRPATSTIGATEPVLAVERFTFHIGLLALFHKPLTIGTVHVTGLVLHIPPHGLPAAPVEDPQRPRQASPEIVVEHFAIRDSRLLIESSDPTRAPKIFELQLLDLERIAPNTPLRFNAVVINPLPRGEIHATGTFGPWIADTPGASSLDGHFTFDHADLGSIHGLGGTLHATGDFRGSLNRVEVTGSTQTPDFALDTAHEPMPLRTTFHALVDGTTGDTSLQKVNAVLADSAFTCHGSVINEKGKGHRIDLTVDIPDAHVQDFLALAVKTRPVLMTGRLTTAAHLHIRPGHERVLERLTLNAHFTLRHVHFSNPAFQQKIDQLSLRAQGLPAQAALAGTTPPSTALDSAITGTVALSQASMTFDSLDYTIPGAEINMQGAYSLDGEHFDFHGKIRTQAQASGMVQSWWKQLLLHAVDKYLSRNGAGVEIPFTVNGTRSVPKFGLDLDQFLRDRQSTPPPATVRPGQK